MEVFENEQLTKVSRSDISRHEESCAISPDSEGLEMQIQHFEKIITFVSTFRRYPRDVHCCSPVHCRSVNSSITSTPVLPNMMLSPEQMVGTQSLQHS